MLCVSAGFAAIRRLLTTRALGPIAALLVLSACRSAPDSKPPSPEPQGDTPPQASSTVPGLNEALVEPEPAFCAEGEEERSRRAYTWCVKEGVLQGNFVALDSDTGKVILEGAFQDGLMEGLWSGYDALTGAALWRAPFSKGEEQGQVEGFDADGHRRYALAFEGGARQGTSSYFDAEGHTVAALEYLDGKPAGTWTYWHPNGQKAHEYTYKEGSSKTSIHHHWGADGEKTTSPVGRLKKSVILPVLEPLESAIVACYMHSRVIEEASGKLVAQIHIGYGGEVSHVDLFADDFEHPFMSACTERAIEALRFPENPYGPQQVIRTWQLAVQ